MVGVVSVVGMVGVVVRVGCGLDSIAYNVRGLEDVSTYASPSSRLTLQFNAEFGPLGVSVERCS